MVLVAALSSVFSAHAEVVPPSNKENLMKHRILRACGGSSVLPLLYGHDFQYSPRMRR